MDHNLPQKISVSMLTSEAQGPFCTSCTTLCDSIHGPVNQECHLRGCYICADFARVNDEIANTYKRLSDLVAERQKYMTQTGHKTSIHRIPVEILSSIFICVKEMLDFIPQTHPDSIVRDIRPRFEKPFTSPALLVGAVCKRWRDVSLTTPQLWTNITINLHKLTAPGQLDMVKEWGHRSGALPLDVTIFDEGPSISPEEDFLSTLRSLASRWNDLALYTPYSMRHRLFDSLEYGPPITSLFLIDLYQPQENHLLCNKFYDKVTPLKWDYLTFLQAEVFFGSSIDEILHIIQHAKNLKHCIVGVAREDGPASHLITHDSLVSFATLNGRGILQHLTLPSLQHLEYQLRGSNDIDELEEFFDRSRPPLDTFRCEYDVYLQYSLLPLESLFGVTSLFLRLTYFQGPVHRDIAKIDDFLALLFPSPPDALSRLKTITFKLLDLTAQSWSLFGRLFSENSDPFNTGTPFIPDDYSPTRKERSGACIPLSDDIKAAMTTLPISRLLEVKQLGVDIHIGVFDGSDLLIL